MIPSESAINRLMDDTGLERGERMLRDASGRIQWANGAAVGRATVQHMLRTGSLVELDTDLFGNPHRGQTLGVIPDNPA